MASIAVHLIPFLLTSTFYILYWRPSHQNNSNSLGNVHQDIVAKCLPIVCLSVFVASYIPDHPVKNYPILLLAGLIFSSIGDAFLVFEGSTYFLQGLICFAIGHLMYTIAFGFNQFKLELLLLCLLFGSATFMFMLPGIQREMYFFSAAYVIIIETMCWRAMSKISVSNLQWPAVCGCLGALAFKVSDLVLSVNEFRFEVPNGPLIIMSTYYLGQLGISLSVVPMSSEKKTN